MATLVLGAEEIVALLVIRKRLQQSQHRFTRLRFSGGTAEVPHRLIGPVDFRGDAGRRFGHVRPPQRAANLQRRCLTGDPPGYRDVFGNHRAIAEDEGLLRRLLTFRPICIQCHPIATFGLITITPGPST